MTFYDLIFTSEKIVAATIEYHGMNSLSKKQPEELQKISLENMLTADKQNFQIYYSNITKVEMKKPGLIRGAKLNIFTNTTGYVFYIKKKKAFNEHVNLVRSVLSDKLSVS